MEKTLIIETFKKSWFYKLIKTTEAVWIGGGLILGVILGWFALLPALILLGGYVLWNALGLSNEEPYVTRDYIVGRVKEEEIEVEQPEHDDLL